MDPDAFEEETVAKASELNSSGDLDGGWGVGEGQIIPDYERGLVSVEFGREIHNLAMIPEQAFMFGMGMMQAAAEMMEKGS